MRTVLLTNNYTGELLDILEKAIDGRFKLKTLENNSKNELLKQVTDVDYILSSGPLEIDEGVISMANNLKMVQRTGVGIDRINLEELKKRNIPLYVNAGVNARSVAEWTLMLFLSTLKRSHIVNKEMREGVWNKTENGVKNRELAGKTVGIIGMGNIGKIVADMLQGFNVTVIYNSRTQLCDEEEKRLGITYVEFDKLLETADIISLHCPYNKSAGCMIGEKEFSKMKDGAVLINTARGKLVDEAALVAAMRAEKLSACGIDVFEEEPIKGVTPLADFDNAIISSHISGLSQEGYERMLNGAIDNIWKFDCGDKDSILPFLIS